MTHSLLVLQPGCRASYAAIRKRHFIPTGSFKTNEQFLNSPGSPGAGRKSLKTILLLSNKECFSHSFGRWREKWRHQKSKMNEEINTRRRQLVFSWGLCPAAERLIQTLLHTRSVVFTISNQLTFKKAKRKNDLSHRRLGGIFFTEASPSKATLTQNVHTPF